MKIAKSKAIRLVKILLPDKWDDRWEGGDKLIGRVLWLWCEEMCVLSCILIKGTK
jgi:hypothetical protein